MKLQELTDKYDLNLELVKAFFLGGLNAQKPMAFGVALKELFEEEPEAQKELETELQAYWNTLSSKKIAETQGLFAQGDLELLKDKLDHFLTGLSLAGTHSESVDEELSEIIDELEDLVEDMEDFTTEEDQPADEAAEIKEFLSDTWKDFLETKKF